MAKNKFYVVWKGLNPGVYDNWNACKMQVEGQDGAKYKSFETREEAYAAFEKDFKEFIKPASATRTMQKLPVLNGGRPILDSIAVDAACSGNPGLMEYRGVYTHNKQEIFHQGPYKDATNNIGEFLALVHALAALKKQGKEDVLIYSDSKIAIGWVKKGKSNTKLEPTGRNEIIFDLIDRAEKWLQSNSFKNPIAKWETRSWGEIPADFGRK